MIVCNPFFQLGEGVEPLTESLKKGGGGLRGPQFGEGFTGKEEDDFFQGGVAVFPTL